MGVGAKPRRPSSPRFLDTFVAIALHLAADSRANHDTRLNSRARAIAWNRLLALSLQ